MSVTRNLLEFPAGSLVRVVEIRGALSARVREHLSAYGIIPGTLLTVLRHLPLTLLAVEHAELALETEVAQEIRAVPAGWSCAGGESQAHAARVKETRG